MPIARFKDVLICSSEDKNYPATNLVNNSNKKWKCEETGLESVYVVLQLEKSTKITGIDIGNEHSAFIEVSVGRVGWPVDKYKTILVSSSFMTIPESRVSENPNRVRCFAKDALMPDVVNEKWDLIKVTCTQGFNKHVQFGLAFIKIHTSADAVAVTSSTESSITKPVVTASPKEKKSCDEALGLPKSSVFAKFRMRVDSSDSDDKDTAGSPSKLFSKWKQDKDSPVKDNNSNEHNVSVAAAIRDAVSSTSKLEAYSKINHKIETPIGKAKRSDDMNDGKKQRIDRYRPALLYDDDDENTSNPKLEKIIQEDKKRIERERMEQLDKKKGKKDNSSDKKNTQRDKKDTPCHEKSKKKMEASAEKFKLFLQTDQNEDESSDALKPNSTKPMNVDDEDGNDNDDDVVEIKAKSPKKFDLTTSPEASPLKSPVPTTPPAWKVKNKRSSTETNENASKRRKSESPERDTSSDVEFDDILRDVVFVISGIQNPERAEIRKQGLEMGAKYKPDWDSSCTHLICAFKNTPKYKHVQGSGTIVNKKWISDCYKKKKKLPWQDYEL